MRSPITIIGFLAILFAAGNAHGQYYSKENMSWAFGFGAGVSFATGAPVAMTTGIVAHEGCAAVCDTAGKFLFYTNGQTVYDRTGTIMPSGVTIAATTLSTTQAAVITPVIGNSNQYYIFSLAESGVLSWSIVDMTLHGGLGDVVSKNTYITDSLTEKMTVIAGNSCDIWLLVHRQGKQKFYAYDITATGISATPVTSLVGTFTGSACYHSGVIKGSPDRTKIIAVCELGTELYDFNPSTGIVSNCRVLGNEYSYGAEFSPDNTKIYLGEQSPEDSLYQYDISLPTTAAIIASKTGIAESKVATDIKLAPDNKIYMNDLSAFSSPYLDCINSPDFPGTACNYVAQVVHLTSAPYIGLPNLYVGFPPVSAGVITGDTVVCFRDSVILSDASPGGAWSSNDSFNIRSGVCVVTPMKFGIDTFLYIVSNGCVADTAMHLITVIECAPPALSLTGAAPATLSIYPDPALGELNISAPYAITSIAISNLFGRQVYVHDYNAAGVQVDITSLSPGTYFVRINGAEVRRFIKQ